MWCHIPEECNPNIHYHENVRDYIIFLRTFRDFTYSLMAVKRAVVTEEYLVGGCGGGLDGELSNEDRSDGIARQMSVIEGIVGEGLYGGRKAC
jgi:hypothetical protein